MSPCFTAEDGRRARLAGFAVTAGLAVVGFGGGAGWSGCAVAEALSSGMPEALPASEPVGPGSVGFRRAAGFAATLGFLAKLGAALELAPADLGASSIGDATLDPPEPITDLEDEVGMNIDCGLGRA